MRQRGKDNGVNIQVLVRARPMNETEMNARPVSVVKTDDGRREITINQVSGGKQVQKRYTFDRVFGPDSTQAEVYDAAVVPIVKEVFQGYNCTIFAYGQTGTGKTYTMEGRRTADYEFEPEHAGIIPRSIEHLFKDLKANHNDFTVRVSYLELYNEALTDLLSVEPKKLRIFDDPQKGQVVMGAEDIVVQTPTEIMEILNRASQKRRTAETLMNHASSRSHTIFTITIHIKETTPAGEEMLKTGKLNLVDLAGSENIGRSGAKNSRAKEAGMINQSLLTLGRVINSLVDHGPHIPYRESKLTRLLQDSLGGKTKTCILSTVSPAWSNIEETMSTLEYANRAKNIKNKPEVNARLTKTSLMKEYTKEIAQLTAELNAAREKNGVYLPADQYNSMMTDLEVKTQHIETLEQQIEAKTKEFEEIKVLFDKKSAEYDAEVIEHLATKTDLKETTVKLEDTTVKLEKTEVELEETNVIVDEHVVCEKELYSEATTVVDDLKSSVADIHGLFGKISRKQEVEDSNDAHSKTFRGHLENHFGETAQRVTEFVGAHQTWCDGINNRVTSFTDNQVSAYNGIMQEVNSMASTLDRHVKKLQADTHTEVENVIGQFDAIADTSSSHVDRIDSFVKEFSDAKNAAMIDFASTIRSQRAETEMWRTMFMAFTSSFVEQTHDFVNNQVGDMSKFHSAVMSSFKQQASRVAELEATVSKHDDYVAQVHVEKKAAFMAQINDLVNAFVADDEKMSFDHCVNVADIATATQGEITEAIVDADAQKDAIVTTLNNFDSDIVAASEDIITNFDTFNAKQDTFAEDIEGIVGKIDELIIDQVNGVKDIVTDHNENMSSKVDSGKTFMSTMDENINMKAEKMNGECDTIKVESISKIDAMVETGNTFKEFAASEITNITGAVGSFKTGIHAEFDNEQERAVKYFEQDLKMDIPTGATPVKRDIPIPDSLTQTRPHEVIVESYRAKKSLQMEEAAVAPATEEESVVSSEESDAVISTDDVDVEVDVAADITEAVPEVVEEEEVENAAPAPAKVAPKAAPVAKKGSKSGLKAPRRYGTRATRSSSLKEVN